MGNEERSRAEGAGGRWDGSRREVVGSPSLGGCKGRLDVVLRGKF